jgi:hypothetical protein
MSTPNDPPPPGGQPPYGQPPYGQPQYGQPPYGQPQYGHPYPPPPASYGTNGMAIASLVCAFFCAPLGLIFGFVARNQIRQTGQQGDGLALAGIIVSAVSMVVGVIWLIVVIGVASHVHNSNPYGLGPLLFR